MKYLILFTAVVSLNLYASQEDLQLSCRTNYRVSGHVPECGATLPKPGPRLGEKNFTTPLISLEATDKNVFISVTSEYLEKYGTAPQARIFVTREKGTSALASANASLLAPTGAALVVQLGPAEVQNPKPGCRYNRYLNIKCYTKTD